MEAEYRMEAEYHALVDTISGVLWLQWLFQDMGVSFTGSSSSHCENTNAIQIVHNNFFYEHTKHIEVDFHFICHHIKRDTLRLYHVTSADELADIFIKAHPSGCHRDLVYKLKLTSSLTS